MANINDIQDKLEIHELLSSYCFHLDLREWDKFRPLFTDDAEWVAPYAHAKTGDDVTALMDSLIPPAGEGPNRKHFVSNLIVNLSGDTATGRANFVVFRESENGIIPSVVGTYVDEYRREGGRWKFRKRDVLHEIMGDLGLRNS